MRPEQCTVVMTMSILRPFPYSVHFVLQLLETTPNQAVPLLHRISGAMGCGNSTPAVEEAAPAAEAEAVPVEAPKKTVEETESAEGREKREESVVEVTFSQLRPLLHSICACF